MKTTHKPATCERLSREGAARYLGVDLQTFKSLRENGRVRAVAYGHRTKVYDTCDLDALIERSREPEREGVA